MRDRKAYLGGIGLNPVVDSSLVYYGYYGPFRGTIDTVVLERLESMLAALRGQ